MANTDLGTTNKILPESERHNVVEVLNDVQSGLQDLEDEIHRLNDMRTRYLAYIDRLRTAIAPHKYLPSEILAEIFVYCLGTPANAAVHITENPSDIRSIPRTVGRVCSRWRQIVKANSCLWNSITFEGREADFPMVNEAFNFCSQSTLRFKAKEPIEAEVDEVEELYRPFLREMILPQTHRFRNLSLTLCPKTLYQFIRFPPRLFDALESVELISSVFLTIPSKTASVFRGARSLRSIRIETEDVELPPFPSFPLRLGLIWSQLTHIEFETIHMHLKVAHELMSRCPDLHVCHLFLSNDPKDIDDLLDDRDMLKARQYSASSICLPKLRLLDLGVPGIAGEMDLYCDYFRPLTLPALEQFNFVLPKTVVQPPIAFATMMNDLALPALCSELHYWANSFLPPEICAPLTFVTSVKALDCGGCLPLSMMDLIAQGQILPKLTSLSACVAPEDMGPFIAMLKARWSQSTEARRPPMAAVIRFAEICVKDDDAVLSRFSQEIHDLAEQLGVNDSDIKLARTIDHFAHDPVGWGR